MAIKGRVAFYRRRNGSSLMHIKAAYPDYYTCYSYLDVSPCACPWTMVNAVARKSSNGGRDTIMLHIDDGG
jgi:hypothetical protein